MKDEKLELIMQNFISIMPLFQKKLIRSNCNFHNDDFNLNHSHFQIMVILKEEGKLPISDVAKKLLISTPNMTKLLNKLIDLEMINRIHDTNDRRIINIEITQQGTNYLNKKFENVKNSMKTTFSALPNKELDKLNSSLENLKDILTILTPEIK